MYTISLKLVEHPWQSWVKNFVSLRILITLPHSKRYSAELSLRAGLTHRR